MNEEPGQPHPKGHVIHVIQSRVDVNPGNRSCHDGHHTLNRTQVLDKSFLQKPQIIRKQLITHQIEADSQVDPKLVSRGTELTDSRCV